MLLQVVFHARVAEEAGDQAFDIDTVAGLLVDKLVRRHPHVFADGDATTPGEVEQAWERIKGEEKGAAPDGGGGYAADLLHGIPYVRCPDDLAGREGARPGSSPRPRPPHRMPSRVSSARGRRSPPPRQRCATRCDEVARGAQPRQTGS